jgi:hypothetical protein
MPGGCDTSGGVKRSLSETFIHSEALESLFRNTSICHLMDRIRSGASGMRAEGDLQHE